MLLARLVTEPQAALETERHKVAAMKGRVRCSSLRALRHADFDLHAAA